MRIILRASFYSTSKIISQFYIQQNHSAENHFVISQKLFINLKRIKMKKLFFTAIALVAFSGVSMAETVVIKQKVDLVRDSHEMCNEAGHKAFVQAMLADVPLEGSFNIAQAVYTLCMSI